MIVLLCSGSADSPEVSEQVSKIGLRELFVGFLFFFFFFQFCQQECEREWESKAERRGPKESTAGKMDTALAVSDPCRAWQGRAEY